MADEFQQWKSAERFNQQITSSISNFVCNYVLLLTETKLFKVEEDLKYTLHITKKPLYWFVEKFRVHGVQVEYGTIFCKKDIEHFGPISQATSQGIVKQYLRSKYPSTVHIVCHPRYAKHLPFQSIHPDTFVSMLLGR